MDIYFFIIIGVIVFEYLLSFSVRTLNIRALSSKLPEEFKDVYDNEKYIKSQDYTKTNAKYSYFTSTFSLGLGLWFILSGFYNSLDLYARGFGFNEIITGILFFGILFMINDILSLPLSIYKTFVIEEKYGFNKTTYKTFITDKIKQYFLLVLIGFPFLYLVLLFFDIFRENAWLVVWLLMASFMVLIQPLFNNFIAPMFNKFTPLEEGPLLEKIKKYLEKVDFPVKKLEVVDGSRRSGHSNAYFSGFGKNKRIALFDTLIEQMDDDEIVAIVAHEVGHYKLKHIQTGMISGIIQTGIMLFTLSLFVNNENLFNVFQVENVSVYASLVFFSMLYAPISIISGVVSMIISRRNEFSADSYSAKTANLPESLISGLKKLSSENLSNLTPHWLNVFLNYSHPPVLDRVNALKSKVS
ncbi:MAG: peptidase M48 [Candidatus Marinimicrobia bacterium]|nr:peptidase M48 [Candidatus Neomarinimicrobiota bacterium]